MFFVSFPHTWMRRTSIFFLKKGICECRGFLYAQVGWHCKEHSKQVKNLLLAWSTEKWVSAVCICGGPEGGSGRCREKSPQICSPCNWLLMVSHFKSSHGWTIPESRTCFPQWPVRHHWITSRAFFYHWSPVRVFWDLLTLKLEVGYCYLQWYLLLAEPHDGGCPTVVFTVDGKREVFR